MCYEMCAHQTVGRGLLCNDEKLLVILPVIPLMS